MKITSYQQNLLSDLERLAALYEAITQKSRGIVYDLGTGSGILSSWAAPLARFVYAVEKDPKTAKLAKHNLKSFHNISIIVDDARDTIFPEKADLIICEMLDTALIDEDQLPVINSARKYLKDQGDIIPCGVIHAVEAINTNISYPCYHEVNKEELNKSKNNLLSNLIVYDKIDFKQPTSEKVKYTVEIPITKTGLLSGIKITTFTLLTPQLICGPTPMMNPPILTPTNHLDVKKDDIILLNLEYTMGGGLHTLKATVRTFS